MWLLLAGRGGGKTRSGAEWVCERVRCGARRITLVGRTASDVRDVMVEGESGILSCEPEKNRPTYEPSKRRITWPNGARATTYSADEPDQMRGPQSDTVWADELAAWQYDDAWTQVMLGLRSVQSGLKPRAVVTTTPRPTKLVRGLIASPTTHTTRWRTHDNAANLAPSFLEEVTRRYGGTRVGRQELDAEVLDDAPGALWQGTRIDQLRVHYPPELRAIVIGVDPAVTSGEYSNETGIVVVGQGADGHAYVLKDASGKFSPGEWARIVAELYVQYQANRVVAEVNQGGDLVEANLQATRIASLSIKKVHAARGKRTRAEPIAALYEQGRVHHIGTLAKLEDQMTSWEPDVVTDDGPTKKIRRADSPDRLDALVWAITDLMVGPGSERHEVLDYYDREDEYA